MHPFTKLHNTFVINSVRAFFFFGNYTEAQSSLRLPVALNLVNEGKAVTQSKKDIFVKTVFHEVQELIFLSFLFQLSENEEDKLKVIV